MLSLIALNGAINRLLRCLPVGDRIESRRLTRSSSSAPVNHVAIEPAVSVQVESETAYLEVEGSLREVNAQLEAESIGLMTRLGPAEYRPYKKQDDGSYVFDFKTKPTVSVPSRGERASARPPRLTNAAGNKLRKPQRIAKGTRVRVHYELYPWSHLGEDRERFDQGSEVVTTYDPEKNWKSLGVGVTLSLQGVELVETNRS
jgi:hypothetical protein